MLTTKSIARAANIAYWRLIAAGCYPEVQNRVAAKDTLNIIADGATFLPAVNTPEGVLLAGTWDSYAAESDLVVLERRPSRGPWTLTLSTVGWPARHGITSRGLAIADTRSRMSRPRRSGVACITFVQKSR